MLATSRGEGMPLAVVEALSSGLAVVATDIPGHVLPGGAPPDMRIAAIDPEAIAAAARPLLGRDAGAAREEGALAHAWVSEELGLEAWSSRLMDLYERVRP
jgi:glycosyltransferase involved in cell wall biosynthesis